MHTFSVIFFSGAAFTDLLKGKIYNYYLLPFITVSLILKETLQLEIFNILVFSALIILLYASGAIAGGDAKLLLACTLIFPFKEIYLMTLVSFFLAGTAGVFIIIKK